MFCLIQKNFLLSNLCTCRNRKSLLQWHFITSNSKATKGWSSRCWKSFFCGKFLESTKEYNLRVTLKRYLHRTELPALTALPRSSGGIRCGSLALFYLKCRRLFAKERFGEPFCHWKLLFIFIAAECTAKRHICINKCNYVTPKSAAAHVSATSARPEWQNSFQPKHTELVDIARHRSARNQTNKAAGGHWIRAVQCGADRRGFASREGCLLVSSNGAVLGKPPDLVPSQIGRVHLGGSRMRQCHSLADIGLIASSG